MPLGNGLDLLVVADVAVDVHGHDRAGLLGNERLNLVRINGVVGGPDVTEDRLEALAYYGVRRGGKREGRGYDLVAPVLAELQGLENAFERLVSVHKERNVVNA